MVGRRPEKSDETKKQEEYGSSAKDQSRDHAVRYAPKKKGGNN